MPEHQQTQQSKITDNTSQKQTVLPKQIPTSHPAAIIQRTKINPKSLTHADVMQLQRTIGNRAVGKLLTEIGLIPSRSQQTQPVQMKTLPEEEDKLQMKSVVQMKEKLGGEEPLQGKFEKESEQEACPSCSTLPIQHEKENRTGMPDNLKAGVESLSGIDMSDVRVHYNSLKPAEVGALAYTQGTNIHVAPGQERHLPHEAWHVVQQAQGRVRPTILLKEISANKDVEMEREADVMSGRAAQIYGDPANSLISRERKMDKITYESKDVIQCVNVVGTDVAMKPAAVEEVHWKMVDETTEGQGLDVHNSVGLQNIFIDPFNHILKPTQQRMHRAHGVARRFGGSGIRDNVGWWPEQVEHLWTTGELNVAGVTAESHLIHDWAVGKNESGTYHVIRQLYNLESIFEQYKNPIIGAINWGYADDRQAWIQTLQTWVNGIQNDTSKQENQQELNRFKQEKKASDEESVSQWFANHFTTPASLVIQSMIQRYTENIPGINIKPNVNEPYNDSHKIIADVSKPFSGRPKNNPDQPRNFENTVNNADISFLGVIQDGESIWGQFVRNRAIIASHGGSIPALQLVALGRLSLINAQNRNSNVYFERNIDGFGVRQQPQQGQQ